jgi:hypothetical protein
MSDLVRDVDSIDQLRRTPTDPPTAAYVRTPTAQAGVFVPYTADPIGNGDDGHDAVQNSDGNWWVRKEALAAPRGARVDFPSYDNVGS